MIVLGIESTAHTFGASIIDSDKKKVLSNVKRGYTTDKAGMIPAKVADFHVENCDVIINEAIESSGKKPKDIKLVSFSQSPGIGHMLKIGAFAARTISKKLDIPIIGVNHCIAHLEIGKVLTDAKDPLLLYASGANTQVIAYEGGKYRIFGETLDIGIGNFLDTLARHMELGFPGGPKISELAKKSNNYIKIPYVVKGMDASFGGILTHCKKLYSSKKYPIEDICYSVQETVFAMLLEVTERAMAHTGKNELLLGGGVACNDRLQEMARIMCSERGARCFILENQYNVDNAAMIAFLGATMYGSGIRQELKNTQINPYQRTDEVEVTWR